MRKINLAITGCLGRMGQQLIKSSKSARNFKLVSITENRIINKKISTNIPRGVDDGTRIRLSGKGEAGIKGGGSGDLYIFVSVKAHSIFKCSF